LPGLVPVLLIAATCAAQVADPHRDAVLRYLTASRTLAIMRHVGLLLAIREAAVDRWGFASMDLGADELTAMESHVDAAELEARVVELHRRYLSRDHAADAAQFYESAAGKRALVANVGEILPPADPLRREGAGPVTDSDQQAFRAFMSTPTGQRLQAIDAALAKDLLDAQAQIADVAIERYVARKNLPNRRAPEGGRR